MINRRIRVFGKVQGVFYRASTKTKADELKLTGWVRNENDGTVLIEVEGDEDRVEKMIIWCKEGPTYARVDDLIFEQSEIMAYKDFEIRY